MQTRIAVNVFLALVVACATPAPRESVSTEVNDSGLERVSVIALGLE